MWFTLRMGASTIKWATLDPCTCLSGSDSKQYTDFKICAKNIIFFSEHIDLQSQAIYVDNNNLEKVYIF